MSVLCSNQYLNYYKKTSNGIQFDKKETKK